MKEQRVRDIAWAIEQNPVEVTIYRTQRVLSEGHYTETTTEVGTYRVRIFLNDRNIPVKLIDEGGRALRSVTWSMLCDASADVKACANVVDVVDVPMLGKLKVVNVIPLSVQGEVVGYQVQLQGMDE